MRVGGLGRRGAHGPVEGGSALAIFGWSKSKQPTPPDPQHPGGAPKAEGASTGEKAPTEASGASAAFSPEKARSFFDRGRKLEEAGQYEYAMTMWLTGMRSDPGSIEGLEGFFRCADRFRAGGDAKASRETERLAGGSTPIDRFLTAVLSWSMNPKAPDLAVRALVAAGDLGLSEVGRWIAPKAVVVLRNEDRPRKDMALRLKEACFKVGAVELALEAATVALRVDPTDNKLAAEVKNLSAEATMSKGGYEQTGQSGGFRTNVRDIDKQRKLEEGERVVKSASVIERVLAEAKAKYQASPADKPSVLAYVKALAERGRPEDEQAALEVLDSAYQSTQEFRFRKAAGDLRIRRARRELRALRESAAATPADAGLAQRVREAEASVLRSEIGELEAQIGAYPTDLSIRFELGKRYVEAGAHERAIEQLQLSKGDARLKAQSLSMLGQAFAAMDWQDEAIDTFRQALEGVTDPGDSAGLDLRYGLLGALGRRAETDRDLPSAEEAYKLASAIAIQQIGYRDIRARRDALKALLASIRAGEAGA